MCYDDNARPPEPPGKHEKAHGEDVVLTSADGSQFAAYLALPINPKGAQVLIYPDVRGLHQFYKELALRFAEVGYPAIAIDYFGRTAGLTGRDESFEFWPHVQQVKLENVLADAQTALDHLNLIGGGQHPTFVVGFCFGGSLAFYTNTDQNIKLAGTIGFYAGLSRKMSEKLGTVLEAAVSSRLPALGLFGGADQNIPVEQVHELDENLDKSGVPHEVVIYPNAPHSFFDRRSADFASESDDAWRRILGFINANAA